MFIALVLVAFAAVFVWPAVAQQPLGVNAGTLTCKMASSIGLIFGSPRQRTNARGDVKENFVILGPMTRTYVGA